MNEKMEISLCDQNDFLQILTDIEDFWGSSRTLGYHHPMFINEFGNTAFVIKENNRVIAYLFGFLSQKERIGYVHLIAIRQDYQNKGLGTELYKHFIEMLKQQGIREIKAITTPSNKKSIKFHLNLGMTMTGNENKEGIKIIKDYSGIGQDRVVFRMKI